jgi:hypothetical protein
MIFIGVRGMPLGCCMGASARLCCHPQSARSSFKCNPSRGKGIETIEFDGDADSRLLT